MEKTLYEKLLSLKHTNEYAFHMPGHKRNETESVFSDIMNIDITEIEGFDNLHCSKEILQEEQDFAAKLYGVDKTFYLVNGSSCGVLAAICAVTENEDPIIFCRNAHKSAYNALYLRDLHPIYIYPERKSVPGDVQGKVNPRDIASKMDETGAKVVFITSPTYEGVISDISEIARQVHERNGVLIVDEAHGAHLGFHSYFLKSATQCGADIVIQSMHKTLPCLTQTALLHICSDRVSKENIAMQLGIFQTSSPSYVLMGSMSYCLHLLEKEGSKLFDEYVQRLQLFYKETENLKNLNIITPKRAKDIFDAQWDPSKINIVATALADGSRMPYAGKELAKELRENYGLQMEMESQYRVLAMTSVYDSEEGFERLKRALFEIDQKLCPLSKDPKADEMPWEAAQCEMTIKAAIEAKKKKCLWKNCVGKISAEYIYLYPPGSPIITPGEQISECVWQEIERYKKAKVAIQGPQDLQLTTLWIVDESIF